MKRAWLILMLYVLAMIQLSSAAFAPDLLLLVVLTVSVFEDRGYALLVGLLAGIFLDAAEPSLWGLNMIIYLVIAYGVTMVRRLVYARAFYLLLFGAGALIAKYGLTLGLSLSLPVWWQLLISSAATLLLLVPVYRLMKYLFRYEWKVA